MRVGLSVLPWLVAGLLAVAVPARALVDLSPSDGSIRVVGDLASSSGVSRPVDFTLGLVDDEAWGDAYRELALKGLVHPMGAKLDRWRSEREGGAAFSLLWPDARLEYHQMSGADSYVVRQGSGKVLGQGGTGFASLSGAGALYDFAALGYELRLRIDDEDIDYSTQRLYVKMRLGRKWSIKVGRDAEVLGPGYHDRLLLGANAPTMDMWRIRSERPLYLPGFLEGLGGWRFTLFNAYLSDDNPSAPDRFYASNADEVEDPRLLGMRLSYHPAHWLDFGLSRTVMYGGEGRGSYASPSRWWDLFTASNENVEPGDDQEYDNDQLASVDVVVRMPFLRRTGVLKGGELYAQYAGDDLIASWQGDDTDSDWELLRFNDSAALMGIYLTSAAKDFRFEYAVTSRSWYRHGQYGQGYSYKGIGLGHHMGRDAQDWFVSMGRYLGRYFRLEASLDWQKRGRSFDHPEFGREWELGLEARSLEVAGFEFQGRLDGAYSKVKDPIDEPGEDERRQWRVGLTLSSFF